MNAIYAPLEQDGVVIESLAVDVTTSLQALVHSSQLYIPPGRPKVSFPILLSFAHSRFRNICIATACMLLTSQYADYMACPTGFVARIL